MRCSRCSSWFVVMVCETKLRIFRAVGFSFCQQTHLFVGSRNGAQFMSLGTSQISDGAGKTTPNSEQSKQDICRTNGDVRTLFKGSRSQEAVQLLDVMEQRGFWEYSETCARLLQECAKRKALGDGKVVHAHIIKSGFESNLFLGNTLVSMYCKCGRMEDARQVFDKMPKRNVISWTAMIAGLSKQGHSEEALEVFRQMRREGFEADTVTFMCALSACTNPLALEQGKRFHADIIEAGLESDIGVGNAIVTMYCKCGSVLDARRVFDKMPKRDVISWNAMITGFAQQRHSEEAFELFRQMQRRYVSADKVSYISILNACASTDDLEEGNRLHAAVSKAGLESDIQVGTALVSMYCKCGNVSDARRVFDKMPTRDVISWNAMIAGLAQQGHCEEAFEVFGKMQQEGLKAGKLTFLSILNACDGPLALEQGKWLHTGIIKAGLESDVQVGNALVTMYCKCGSLMARTVFDRMPRRNVISWNALIAGVAQQGHGEESIELFWQMQREGIHPNEVTFISILNASSGLAALEVGKKAHALISNSGFESDVRVCNALIDMYAKCGSLGDARRAFDTMPQRDVITWNSMIVACAQHGLGRGALHLFEEMLWEGCKPDNVTFVSVLSACSHMGLVEEGNHYFLSMRIDHGITPTGKHYGCMVDVLGRAGRLADAEDLINKMPFEPDASVWGALLGACKIYGNVEVAERAAECILKLEPENAAVYVLLSNIYAAAGRWDDITMVRKAMNDRGVQRQEVL